MNKTMTFGERLKHLRKHRGVTLQDIEDATGISHSALGRYENDQATDVSIYNLTKLAKYYDVSGDYLLGLSEQANHPNTPIESLHIETGMIQLLRSGKINNRLLSEMVTNEHFVRFMLDAEVFVDRGVSYVISILNEYYKKNREELYKKGGDKITEDSITRSLDMFPIDDNKYVRDILHEDLDMIMDELQEKHKDDSTTMQSDEAELLLEESTRISQEAAEGEKNASWAQVASMICAQIGIRFHNLSDHQKEELIGILQTSRILYPGMSQRGKNSKHIRKMTKKRIGEETDIEDTINNEQT